MLEKVPVEELAPVLRHWRERYDAESGTDEKDMGARFTEEVTVMGSIDYLAWQSGIDQRKVRAVMQEEIKNVTYRTAELLLMAIDRYYMLDNGELTVIS